MDVCFTKTVQNYFVTKIFVLIFVVEQVFSEESDEGGGIDETAPPKPSRGPDIEFPLQRKDIDLLIEAFRKKKVTSITLFIFFLKKYKKYKNSVFCFV